MGLFDFFRRGKRQEEKRGTPTEADYAAGVYNDTYFTDSPTVRLCIDRIAQTISTLPMFLQKDGRDVPRTNSANYLLTFQPNEYQTIAEFMRELVKRMLSSDAFVYVQKDLAGRAMGMHLLDGVQAKFAGGRKTYWRNGIQLTETIMHFHQGHLWGEAINSRLADLIALERHLLNFSSSFFRNGISPTTIITLPPPAGENSKAAYDALKAKVTAEFAGSKNHGKPIFRQSDVVKIDQLDQPNARNAMLVECMEYVRSEIARQFHIPTAMLDSAKANNSIMESETRQYYAQAILPKTELIRQEFRANLLGTYYTGIDVQFDYSILLKPSPEALARIMNIYRYAGVLTVNEIRKELGYQPVPDGDTLPTPSNLLIPGATGEAFLTANKDKTTDSNNANL